MVVEFIDEFVRSVHIAVKAPNPLAIEEKKPARRKGKSDFDGGPHEGMGVVRPCTRVGFGIGSRA